MLSSFNQAWRVRTRSEWRKFDRLHQQKIILMSKRQMRRFVVFSDQEVGIIKRFQGKLREMCIDEDYDSSDEIVQSGVQRSVRILSRYIKGTKSQRNNSQEKSQASSKCTFSQRPCLTSILLRQ